MLKPLQKVSLLLIAGLGLGSVSASGQTFYEPFNGTGTVGGADATTAGATSNGWTTHSPSPSNTSSGTTGAISIETGSLTYAGLAPAVGNKVLLPGTNSTVSRDINADVSAVTGTATTAYFSALVNVVDETQLTEAGDYFMHFGNDAGAANTNLFARLFVKKTATGYRLAIQNISSGTPTQTEYPLDLVFGTTYLVVVKYEIKTGNDMATLWVNPTLGATEPEGGATNESGTGTGATRFQSINLRNGSATPKAYVDEIRVGTTFASVTPGPLSVKEFAAGKISLSPNPTAGATKLTLPANFPGKDKLAMTVYGLDGKVLLQAAGNEQAINAQLNASLGKAAAGVYLLKVEGGGQTYQTRIVKR
ncbi:T9SS type A sorting domain-containing protein [Rufibacter psychrotolerans]|uniref:T9SS type A sorting domain-containing protein n=1 Tax=Rufibacter psychrotolerans TaxID=2812556 RepID=UPI001967BDD9|nr:T9SS type A sorting domain-containing protein [Rufibacter sp. SYSU D00308]